MNRRLRDFLLDCERIDFGRAELSEMENTFCRRFSNEILSLCRSLPKSAQTDAMFFFMEYSGLNLGGELDFFSHFYPPVWSILYWLSRYPTSSRRLKRGDITYAVTAQSMAMFLHSLDDHLTDRQVPVSPLTLLLRTRAWAIMDRAMLNLADGVSGGRRTVQRFMDEYYSGIQDSNGLKFLENYCDLFRKQMALGMIAPTLLSMKMTGMSDFTRDLQIAYSSFGIAWRLLDDIRDISHDIEKRSHTSIYLCLPRKIRTYWDNNTMRTRTESKHSKKATVSYILEHSLIDKIKERICAELEKGASIVEAHNMIGLAREFWCLAHPLRNRGRPQEECNGKPGISLVQM